MSVNVRVSGFLTSVVLAGIALGSATTAVHAFDPSARFSLAGQLGGASLALNDVNDQIGSARAYMRAEEWKVLDDINFGYNWNVDLRADLFGPWMLSVSTGQLSGSSSVDFDNIVEVKPTATFLQARVFYRLPWRPKESIRFALGGGYLHCGSGELEVRHEQRTVEAGTERIEALVVDASGGGAVAALEGELILNETFTIVGDLGYRYLNLGQDGFSLDISRVARPAIDGSDPDEIPEGRDLSDASILRHSFLREDQRLDQVDIEEFGIEDFDLDFSGVQVNVGLRVYIF